MASQSATARVIQTSARFQVRATTEASRSSLKIDPVLAFHSTALAWYLRVWLWHLSPAAAQLPGAKGFGWFTRYLTFYSFSLQLIQLSLCCFAASAKASKLQSAAAAWADDLSCALFGLANAVTIMFYFLEAATKDMVEGGQIARPPWLGLAVHLGNSLTAWIDLVWGQQRSFSLRSLHLSLVLIGFYNLWILLSSYFNGAFPYPFLNKLPWPQGFVAVTLAGQLLFFLLFKLGKQLRNLLQQARLQIATES